jgi:hypothetical protein
MCAACCHRVEQTCCAAAAVLHVRNASWVAHAWQHPAGCRQACRQHLGGLSSPPPGAPSPRSTQARVLLPLCNRAQTTRTPATCATESFNTTPTRCTTAKQHKQAGNIQNNKAANMWGSQHIHVLHLRPPCCHLAAKHETHTLGFCQTAPKAHPMNPVVQHAPDSA